MCRYGLRGRVGCAAYHYIVRLHACQNALLKVRRYIQVANHPQVVACQRSYARYEQTKEHFQLLM